MPVPECPTSTSPPVPSNESLAGSWTRATRGTMGVGSDAARHPRTVARGSSSGPTAMRAASPPPGRQSQHRAGWGRSAGSAFSRIATRTRTDCRVDLCPACPDFMSASRRSGHRRSPDLPTGIASRNRPADPVDPGPGRGVLDPPSCSGNTTAIEAMATAVSEVAEGLRGWSRHRSGGTAVLEGVPDRPQRQ